MKIVIDIPEEAYKKIQMYGTYLNPKDKNNLEKALKNSTPLPAPRSVSQMMFEIYMEGVNMTGEYQGCWVRYKDIEKIIKKYMEVDE